MKKYFILAWLPGEDSTIRVVLNPKGGVRMFERHQEAWDFYVDHMTPDWECFVLPLDTVEIYDDQEVNLSIQSKA